MGAGHVHEVYVHIEGVELAHLWSCDVAFLPDPALSSILVRIYGNGCHFRELYCRSLECLGAELISVRLP